MITPIPQIDTITNQITNIDNEIDNTTFNLITSTQNQIISTIIYNNNNPTTTTINTEMEKDILTTIIQNKIITSTIPNIKNTSKTENEECSNNEILNNKCNKKITNEQIKEVYTLLKEEILNKEINLTNNNKIFQTENAVFQISTLKEQESGKYSNVSSIELGECEKKIKDKYNIDKNDDLIIFKTDLHSDDSSAIYVQYEIYNPYNFDYIPLDICKDDTININIPINLDKDTESLYLSLSESGYNLFDSNDSFYNDICSTYTTENGTDITLLDRKNMIYDNNKNTYLCQNNCEFILYNETTKKSKCNCNVQKELTITDIKEIKFNKTEFIDNFLMSSLKNSNFKVVKCYKLIFSFKGQLKNIGSYILIFIIFILIICMIIYCFIGNKKLNHYAQLVIKQKFMSNQNTKTNKIKDLKTDIKNNNNKLNKEKNKTNIKNKMDKKEKKKTNKPIKNKEKSLGKKKDKNKSKTKNKKIDNHFPPKKKKNNKKYSSSFNLKNELSSD